MSSTPLVSIIVPTKNSGNFLDACLESIKKQSYQNIEIIVVDNFSTDKTKEIALKYTDKFFSKGPERSAQRNFGVENTVGEYVTIIDSDMVLSQNVISECVSKILESKENVGVIIPEESFGVGFWAQCKKLERSFYVGVRDIEAARFFSKEVYKKAGGYDENMVSGEDWDLSRRVEKLGNIGNINSFIYHNEGKISLIKTLKKKYYYAQKAGGYIQKNNLESTGSKFNEVFKRFFLFFSQPVKLFSNPLYGFGMLFMKVCEYGFGFVGIIMGKSPMSADSHTSIVINGDIPFVTYILPTYNAEKYLERCLDSIFMQDYPKDKFEVMVADGFSTDRTRDILSKYDIKLINNEKIVAEYGKKISLNMSKGEYIVLIDSDNIITSPDWLKKMISCFENNKTIDYMESNYLIADDFTSINAYANLLVIVDPLARMLASKPAKIENKNDVLIKFYDIGSAPVAGANGFIWKKSKILEHLRLDELVFAETNLLTNIASKEKVVIGSIKNVGIHHYYCTNFLDYVKKRQKIGNKFMGRKNEGINTWVDKRELKLVVSAIYLGSFIGPIVEAVYMYIRSGRKEWFWHPLVSFLTIYVYFIVFLKKISTQKN